MKEVQSALNTAAADDSKLVLFSAVGSIFCCGLDFIYFIRRLTDDRKKESTKMAEAIRYVRSSSVIERVRFIVQSGLVYLFGVFIFKASNSTGSQTFTCYMI